MNLKHKLREQDVHKINNGINQGIVDRASDALWVMALLFSVYGLMSTGIISKYDSSVTMWSNTWPRILFNGIPFAVLAWLLKRQSWSYALRISLWAGVQPIIFVFACCIYVWPLMMEGHTELYKYFHAANMFVITFGFIFVAPSPHFMLVHVASYTIFFLVPLLFIVQGDRNLYLMIVNDYLCMTIGACFAGRLTYRLRRKVSLMDAQIKSDLTSIVGVTVASAIYNDSLERLNDKKAFGLILSMDLRGYTRFLHSIPKEISSSFMREYHFMVSTTVGKFNGFIHKTAGDSHLVSFGLMDESADLSDISELQGEVAEAESRKVQFLASKATLMFEEIVDKFEKLKMHYDISEYLKMGAALAAGPIEIRIQGNKNYRQEVDIEGDAIVRSMRLESYTKLLINRINPVGSLLILSPELIEDLQVEVSFHVWNIREGDQFVRDYPQFKQVYYKAWLPMQIQSKKLVS